MDKTTSIDGMGTEGSYHLDKEDKGLSISHLKDSLEYNFRHAEEHLTKARESVERLHSANEHVSIPKSLLDLAAYFEAKAGRHTDTEHADMKLKNYVKRTY